MFIIKLFYRDGTIIIESASVFQWDSDHPGQFEYTNAAGLSTIPDSAILRVMIYLPGGTVIFTRDLTTGQPIEHFNV